MTISNLIKSYKLGYKLAAEKKLHIAENWNPLLIYIHVSRFVVGFILGCFFGICLSGLFYFFKLLCIN